MATLKKTSKYTRAFFVKNGAKGGQKTKETQPKDYFQTIAKKPRKNNGNSNK